MREVDEKIETPCDVIQVDVIGVFSSRKAKLALKNPRINQNTKHLQRLYENCIATVVKWADTEQNLS